MKGIETIKAYINFCERLGLKSSHATSLMLYKEYMFTLKNQKLMEEV